MLYHDDAVFNDFEDASPAALKAYAAAGLPNTIEALRADPAVMQRWTRFKSRYLIDFTKELTAKVRAIALEVCGTPIDLKQVTADIYSLAGTNDHITPWQS